MKDSYDFSNAKRGAVIQPTGKTRISIFLDDDVIEAFRSKARLQGKGYQTMMNEALRAALAPESMPATQAQMDDLIQIVRSVVISKKQTKANIAGVKKPRRTLAHHSA